MSRGAVNVVGAGLAGPLLAILLARRGFAVTLYERREDPRHGSADAGRSINLALAARGIRALQHAGLVPSVRPLMIPMRGRMVHEPERPPALQPYGQREEEVIYSVGRAALNRLLIVEAARQPGITLRFDEACSSVSLAHDRLALRALGVLREVPLAPAIATDGAGSAVRTSLAAQGLLTAREAPLDHDYKELAIPPVSGRHALDPSALHVWPRRGFMLIALPNTDGSFTATLFLPRAGPVSFAALEGAGAGAATVDEFFAREFPDAYRLVPDLARQFHEHPRGRLGTVHTAPWHIGGEVLLLGDAAHAIVPFHGQGMNAAFEDCRILDESIDAHDSWEARFAAFEAARRPNAEAIGRMAIENYAEMREAVLEARFLRQKAWALELECRFPDRFIPRYSMVMFHPEIPYAQALRRGAVQQEILDALEARSAGSPRLDLDFAREMIDARL
ncbi:MAG: FAD-dependent oxidoreductase [Steroidobacteraceae bacterium]